MGQWHVKLIVMTIEIELTNALEATISKGIALTTKA